MAESVSLKHFLRTLELGRIRLGMRDHEVAAILGKPDAVGGVSNKYQNPSLWKYGDVEFCFNQQTRELSLIVITFWEPGFPSGGSAIQLDPWLIKGGLKLNELCRSLKSEGIEYREVEPINFGTRELLVNSSISMIFNEDEKEFPDRTGLCKLCASER